MTDIELRNENGTIVGYDQDGNKVPISFGDTEHESVVTDRASIKSAPQSVTVWKADGEVHAAEQSGSDPFTSDTDAATVIQAANDDIADTGGKIVIREGTYSISSTITLDQHISVTGMGPVNRSGGTVLQLADSADTDMFNVDDSHISAGNDQPFFNGLYRISLDGNKANNTSGRAWFSSNKVKDVFFRDIFVNNFAGTGIQLEQTWGLVAMGILIEHCDGDGLDASLGTEGKIIGCKINANANNGGYNLRCNSDRLKILGNEFASPGASADGAALFGGNNYVLVGYNRFNNMNASTDVITANCDLSIIAANDIRGDGTSVGIGLASNSQDNRVFNNRFQDVGTRISRGGTRNIVNGLGINSGDPSSTGDWNGNGVEGVLVRDTSNNNTYLYNNGSWSQIASA